MPIIMNEETMNQWLKERDEAVLSLDVEKLKAFYLKWQKSGIYDEQLPSDEVLEISMRKSICGLADPPKDKLAEAKEWLKKRGYSCEW